MKWWYVLTWKWHLWRMKRAIRALTVHGIVLKKVFPKADPMRTLARELEGVSYKKE